MKDVQLCFKSESGQKYCAGLAEPVELKPSNGKHRKFESGDEPRLVERLTGTALTQVRYPGAANDFSPRLNFQCRLSHGVRTPPCAIACVNICAHVKDPVVHVRVRCIMETLKHPACTLGWVSRHCSSWLSPGKGDPNFPWKKSHWDKTVINSKKKNNFFLLRSSC